MAEDKLTFVAIVLVAIVAIVGILGSMVGGIRIATGAVSGALNVTISGNVDITLTDAISDLGSGYVYANSTQATINSEGSGTNWSVSPNIDPMVLNNNGTSKAKVNISASKDAATFLTSGASQSYKSTAAVGNCTGTQQTVYTALGLAETNLCDQLEYVDGTDSLTINYQLVVPVNTTQGAKGNTITFTGYSA